MREISVFSKRHADDAGNQRRQNECRPITDADIIQQHPARERADHVERALRDVDDAEQGRR